MVVRHLCHFFVDKGKFFYSSITSPHNEPEKLDNIRMKFFFLIELQNFSYFFTKAPSELKNPTTEPFCYVNCFSIWSKISKENATWNLMDMWILEWYQSINTNFWKHATTKDVLLVSEETNLEDESHTHNIWQSD